MPFKEIAKRQAYQNKYYFDKVKWLREYKETNPCVDCDKIYPFYIMQFDHKQNKFKQVSRLRTYSTARILEEIEKCDLVCANCHATRTHLRAITPVV